MKPTSTFYSPFEEEVRPYGRLSSAPSRVRSAVASIRLFPSPWRTILSFIVGDVIGLLSVLAGTYLISSWVAPIRGFLTYDALLVIPGAVLFYAIAGLYQRRFAHPALEMQRIGGFTVLVGLGAAVTLYLVTGVHEASVVIAIGSLVGAIAMPVCRALFRILFSRSTWWGFPAVVVSTGSAGRGILTTLDRWPEIGVRPVALLSDTTADDELTVPVQGGYELAPYLAREFDIPYAILAMPGLTHQRRANLLAHYSKFFDHVFVVSDWAGSAALWTTGRSGDGLFGYGVRNVALRPTARFVKRMVDVVGALFALLVLAPVLVGIALLIRMDAPGAVFYRQERMGREGRIITILKFRTMYEDATERLAEILHADARLRREYEQYHKLQNDPRVTRIGRVLRRYSLDELPQLFNVLSGEMSLVGPRAYMPSELDQMNGLARAVLQSAPGMTGLWQVSGRNHVSFADRVNLDVHYIQNWSPWLDLYLMVRTGPVVLTGDGAS